MEKLKISYNCSKRSFIEKIFGLDSLHEWQKRATNKYGLPTYEVCLKCNKARERNSRNNESVFSECERIEEFDSQFDNKAKYIYE